MGFIHLSEFCGKKKKKKRDSIYVILLCELNTVYEHMFLWKAQCGDDAIY